MKLRELISDINVLDMTADPETDITDICCDVRNVRPDTLFVTDLGFGYNSRKYIQEAMAKGATAVLCENKPVEGVPYILVENSCIGYAYSNRTYFGNPAAKMKVIGITGTNGKTTTSYLIKHMLERDLGVKVGLIGTIGNMIGDEFLPTRNTTPESYTLWKLFHRMLEAGCTYVVMEVTSHALAQDRVAGIRFHTAAYSNLTQDHLDFHGTMEKYAAAKKILFSHCNYACLNLDDSWADFMAKDETCHMLNYAVERCRAELRASEISLTASGVSFTANYKDLSLPVHYAVPGMFSVYNALCAMATGLTLGLTLEQCADAIGTSHGVKGRMETVPTDGDYSVIIDFAHTPDAMENILLTLKPLTRGRLIVVFGCGGDRDRTKRPIMGAIAATCADYCVVTSDNPRTEDPFFIITEILLGMRDKTTPRTAMTDRIEAIHYALDMAQPGDVIVLAGKGHEDYQEINGVRKHFDEREIIASWLNQRKK